MALNKTFERQSARMRNLLKSIWNRRDGRRSPSPVLDNEQPGGDGHWPIASLRDRERVDALQRHLTIEFSNPTLLREALTHRSYLNEIDQTWPSNERLE